MEDKGTQIPPWDGTHLTMPLTPKSPTSNHSFLSFIHPTIFESLLWDTALGTKDPRYQDTSSPGLVSLTLNRKATQELTRDGS